MSEDLMEVDSRKFFIFVVFHTWIWSIILTVTDTENEQVETKQKPNKQRFEVKKWTAVAFWSWGKYFL